MHSLIKKTGLLCRYGST